jgi:biopolymer transport protein ExbB/TolQ
METTSTALVPQDFSFFALIRHADPIVQAVILCLLLCSIASWAIILAKIGRLTAFSSEIGQLEKLTRDQGPPETNGLAAQLLAAAKTEYADVESDGTRPGEARTRLIEAMREKALARLKSLERGLPYLATVGSAAPFVGLFGTVWGIMHSFTSIAQAKDTSLAVVAPGIAEALFATAVGLFAAIPAVIAYNHFATALGRASDRIGKALPGVARALLRGRQPDARVQVAAR